MKIIYIIGDGRSGSTILDSVLGNNSNTISVGECARFWNRFYEKETFCGCSDKIEECILWSRIDKSIKTKYKNYCPESFREKVKYILYFKNFSKIPELVDNPDWKEFCDIVKHFYLSISKFNQNKIIIDSTKFPNWGYFLFCLDFAKINFIHLERNLQSVANSWKKKIILPEYHSKTVYMPIKSNFTILKNWIKIKYLCNKIEKNNTNFIFVEYEEFCQNPKLILNIIIKKTNIELDINNLQIPYNHSIGGNPVRSNSNRSIKITNKKDNLVNLNLFESTFFQIINFCCKKYFS